MVPQLSELVLYAFLHFRYQVYYIHTKLHEEEMVATIIQNTVFIWVISHNWTTRGTDKCGSTYVYLVVSCHKHAKRTQFWYQNTNL